MLMEQASLALREQICRLGGAPELTADVLGALDASRRAQSRWAQAALARRLPPAPATSAAAREVEARATLCDVPHLVAPFCHDVLLYRAFIGPAYEEAARDWLGPAMWHLTQAVGGWRRAHRLPLTRLADEALAARGQAPSFLQPPSYRLRALGTHELWELIQPWVRKYTALNRLSTAEMAQWPLTAGAWLWVLDRTDADVRRRAAAPDPRLDERVMRLAERVDQAVGLGRRRA